ncbi:sigma-70 family RNA polymerase sigma factor [Peribacillus alkalitolerans]|uniref:sigma-70 family RNA polymerase sigma factor n=1 Tax=Peribacillus alkalitolerans TaxID=1550385 RepID=UPI0013D18ACD|nr:sigma-70 family RNA polymerase sigma factor [Peribacillus alkalitolerans]
MNLDEIYKTHVNDLYRYLYSLSKNHFTAEDLVQEAFYRAYIQLEDYEIQSIRGWLFKVAYHAFIDEKRKSNRLVLGQNLIEGLDQKSSPEQRIIEKEGLNLLLEVIHTLPEKEKHVLLLCDLNQLSYQEAADILELRLNTLKSHLHRGRKKVMKMVKERKIQE